MNKFLQAFLVLSLGAVLGYLISGAIRPSGFDSANGSSLAASIENYEDRISELSSRNLFLLQELEIARALLGSTIKNHNNENLVSISSSPQENPSEEDPVSQLASRLSKELADRDAQAFTDKILNNIESDGYAGFVVNVSEQFNAESVDLNWAPSEEEKIYNMFVDQQELSSIALINAECKSKQCKISFGASGFEQSGEVVALVTELLVGQQGHVYHAVNHDPVNNISKVYISKYSHVLESK